MNPAAPPTLAGEIGKIAWFIAKFLAVAGAVIGLLAWIFLRNPVAAVLTLYVMVFGFMIIFFGWQNFKSKKRDWEYQQEQQRETEERERKREEREREHAERIARIRDTSPPPAGNGPI
jgi:amino acid permease